MLHQQHVDPQRLDQPSLDPERCQAERRQHRVEEGARMRLETHHRMGPVMGQGDAARGLDHHLMPQMHPIEITKRHHRAAMLGGQFIAVTDQAHGKGEISATREGGKG